MSRFPKLAGQVSIALLATLAVGACISGQRKNSVESAEAVYMNLTSKDVLWINEREDSVRLGDVTEPSGACEEGSSYFCVHYFSINIAIPKSISTRTAPWMDSGTCYRVAAGLSNPKIYEIRMSRDAICSATTSSEVGSILLFSKEQGVVYFEDMEAPQQRSSWVKVSARGIFASGIDSNPP